MDNLKNIFQNLKETFCSLWQIKERGKTLEIITPYSTITSKFISVFITERDNSIIISDGGWVASGQYDVEVNAEDDEYFSKLFYTYESYFEIKKIYKNGQPFYYKKADKAVVIPSFIFDIVQFIQGVVGGSVVEFEDLKEKEEKESFKRDANFYIGKIALHDTLRVNAPLSEDLKSVKFSAIITKKRSRLTLLSYVTGSNPSYFIGSIGKANLNFEIATESEFSSLIDTKIALINDTASGFQKDKLYRYLEKMERNTNTKNILWSEKNKLDEYLV
jgi:hypothetical protein